MLLAEGSYGNRSTKAGPYRASLYSRSYAAAFTPLQLRSLRAWYDAELGQPKYGGPGAYVQLDGTSGDYIYTPDAATVSFSNDIEVVMRVKVTDWSAAAIQTLVGKYVTTGNQRSWKIASNTSAQIIITVSTDGTTTNTATITPSVALPDNTWIWLRLRMDLTNGSNSVGTVETAADTGTNDEPSSWTANGTATATALAGIFDSTAPLEIGSFQNGTSERLAGQVGRCIVRSGFAGTTVADFNASDCYGPGYTHSSGYAWTLGLPKIYDRSGNGVAPATFGAGSNQPTWLPWDGTPSVYLPGASDNYVSCPDTTALDITEDIEIVARVRPALWVGLATDQAVLGKWNSGTSQKGFAFHVVGTAGGASGHLRLYWSANGSITTAATSTVPVGFAPSTTAWIKATFDVNNGADGHTARFFVAPDQESEPTSWTQLGVDVVNSGGAAPTSIFSNNEPLVVGQAGTAQSPNFQGSIYRTIVRSGIGGTTVADFDAGRCGQSGYTDAYSNAWAITRATSGRKAVVQSPVAASARSVILHGTDDYTSVPAAAIPPSTAADNLTYAVAYRGWSTPVAFGRVFSTQANSTSATAGIYLSNPTTTSTQWRAADGVSLAGGPSGTNFRNGIREMFAISIGSAGQTATVDQTATLTSVALGGVGNRTSTPARVGSSNDGSGFQDFEFEALAIVAASTSDTERGQLTAYYKGGL